MKNVLQEVHNIEPISNFLHFEGVDDETDIVLEQNAICNLFFNFEKELKNQLNEKKITSKDILQTIKLDYNVYNLLSQLDINLANSNSENSNNTEGTYLLEKEVFKYFRNVFSPANFFRFINDLSIYSYNEYCIEPIKNILIDKEKLKQINEFYNNYSSICKESVKKGYSLLYLFQLLSQDLNDLQKDLIDNILALLTCDDIKKRKLACNLMVEYENAIRSWKLKLEDRKEYYHKLSIIDKNLKYVLKMNSIKYGTYYDIDSLYYLVTN